MDRLDDRDGPYARLPRWSGPPFGEALLKRCDRWCERDLAEVWQATSSEELWRPLALGVLSGRDSTHHWEVPALFHHRRGDRDGLPPTHRLPLVRDRGPSHRRRGDGDLPSR